MVPSAPGQRCRLEDRPGLRRTGSITGRVCASYRLFPILDITSNGQEQAKTSAQRSKTIARVLDLTFQRLGGG